MVWLDPGEQRRLQENQKGQGGRELQVRSSARPARFRWGIPVQKNFEFYSKWPGETLEGFKDGESRV